MLIIYSMAYCIPGKDNADDFDTSTSVEGRPLCYLQFADDINLLGGSEEELQNLIERLDKTAAGYGMEISSAKAKSSTAASSQGHLPTPRMNELEGARRSGLG